MNRKLISKAFNDIDEAFIVETMNSPVKHARPSPERTVNMGKFEKPTYHTHSRRLISLILAACLVFALAVTAYATAKSFGLLDYLQNQGMDDIQSAEQLLLTSSELYEDQATECTAQNPDEENVIYYSTSYAKYTILEAVCDSQTIYLATKVKPLNDYFLIPQYLTSEDTVANLIGMADLFENPTEMTIGEYVSMQGKTLAYAGISYWNDLEAEGMPLTGGEEYCYDGDGTLYFYHTAQNIWDTKEFTVRCTGNGYRPGANVDDIERVNFVVKVTDRSSLVNRQIFSNFDPEVKAETGIDIISLTFEETEMGLYATFCYSDTEAKFDGVFFKIVDNMETELPNLPGTSGTGEIDNEDGTFTCMLNYQKPESMDGLQLVIRDVWNSVNYGPYAFY